MNGFVRLVLWVAGILGAIGVILYAAFFDVWTVPADDPQFVVSIEPTLSAGDVVLISRHGASAFGDVVRCTDPDAPGRFVVGRIVGGQGDKVDIVGESLTVNGSHAPSPRACSVGTVVMKNPASGIDEKLNCAQQEFAGITHEAFSFAEHPEAPKSVVVESDRVFLLSENRHMHLDSRDFGSVPPSSCRHVVLRLWSAVGFGDSSRRFTLIW